MDLTELKAKHPEIYNQAFALGIKAERDRHKALDAIALPGNDAIIAAARYETGDSAEAVALKIIAAEKEKRVTHLNDVVADVAASNLTQIPAAPAPSATEEEMAQVNAAAAKIAAAANEGRK